MSDKNTYYLADWISGKLPDEALKSIVGDAEYETYLKIRKATAQMTAPEFDIAEKYQMLQEQIQASKIHKTPAKRTWVYAVAAAFLMLLGGTYYLNVQSNFQTASGQTNHLALNDGTRIEMNAKSKVSYPKYRSQRTVTLDGEAYFEVTKKGGFQVTTPNGIVKVLGTKFNVISRADFFEVTCYEGKVRVETNTENILLTPGKAWRKIHNQTDMWKTSENKATWLNGVSSFRSVPLSYVLKSLENQYGISIDAKKIDASRIFTGSFTHESLHTALQSVCVPLQLRYQIVSKNKVILSQ